MTATPDAQMADSPEQPTTGECLICYIQQPLLPGGAVADHLTSTQEQGSGDRIPASSGDRWRCMGSRHTTAREDGRDHVRRLAVVKCTAERAEAAGQRAEMTGEHTGARWRLRDLVSYYTANIVEAETRADMWRRLAIHGDWAVSLKDALEQVAGRNSSTNALDNALGEMERSAARSWIRSIRWDVGKHFAKGLTSDELITILFSI